MTANHMLLEGERDYSRLIKRCDHFDKKLFEDAQAMLNKIVMEKRLKANGVFAFYEANSNDQDDVIL